MYRRSAINLQTGALTWKTQPLRLSDQSNGNWNSYPAIAASANAVHVAWVGAGTARYRRLIRGNNAWTIEPIRDTWAPGPGPDYGPSIAVRGDDEIHLLTPTGRYALSSDGGHTWTAEQVPVPPGLTMKGPALALDVSGNGHITFTGQV